MNLKIVYFPQASVINNKHVINPALTSDAYICLKTWYTDRRKIECITYFLVSRTIADDAVQQSKPNKMRNKKSKQNTDYNCEEICNQFNKGLKTVVASQLLDDMNKQVSLGIKHSVNVQQKLASCS